MSSLYVQRLVFFSAQIFAQFEYFFKNGGLVGLMRVKKWRDDSSYEEEWDLPHLFPETLNSR